MSGHTSSGDRPGSTEPDQLTTDEVFALLQRRERREVIELLQDVEGPVELATLAEHVAPDGVDGAADRGTVVSLVHVHLPRLADAGFVKYDREVRTVHYRGNGRLESLLAAVGEDSDE